MIMLSTTILMYQIIDRFFCFLKKKWILKEENMRLENNLFPTVSKKVPLKVLLSVSSDFLQEKKKLQIIPSDKNVNKSDWGTSTPFGKLCLTILQKLTDEWMDGKLMVPGLGGMKDSSVQPGQWYELANIHLILK